MNNTALTTFTPAEIRQIVESAVREVTALRITSRAPSVAEGESTGSSSYQCSEFYLTCGRQLIKDAFNRVRKSSNQITEI